MRRLVAGPARVWIAFAASQSCKGAQLRGVQFLVAILIGFFKAGEKGGAKFLSGHCIVAASRIIKRAGCCNFDIRRLNGIERGFRFRCLSGGCGRIIWRFTGHAGLASVSRFHFVRGRRAVLLRDRINGHQLGGLVDKPFEVACRRQRQLHIFFAVDGAVLVRIGGFKCAGSEGFDVSARL